MAKYIIKESELRSVINTIVTKELSEVLNESVLGHVLGSALKNTLKYGALAAAAPALLANKGLKKGNDIVNNGDTVTDTVKDFLGLNDRDNYRKSNIKSKKEDESEFNEYGTPVVVPYSNELKLAGKEDFTVSSSNSKNNIEWGSFGRHYRDKNNAAWNKKLNEAETYFVRRSNDGSPDILKNRLKRGLIGWLDKRDAFYEKNFKKMLGESVDSLGQVHGSLMIDHEGDFARKIFTAMHAIEDKMTELEQHEDWIEEDQNTYNYYSALKQADGALYDLLYLTNLDY